MLLLFSDTTDIMLKMKKDEREKMHEAIAERNALWGVVAVLTAGILYDLITNALQERFYVNPFIAAALIVALLIKSITNLYLLHTKSTRMKLEKRNTISFATVNNCCAKFMSLMPMCMC